MTRVPVETVLTARDVNTAATLRSLAHMAGGLQQAVSMAQRAFGTFNALALGGGIALGAQSLIKFNQELESTTQNLAGSIQVYKYANNYADALLLAGDALEKIKRDAAALPGTDTDFIRAFAITFPEQAQLGVKTLDEAIKRSNNLTAVLLAKGVDSGQIGRDVGQMLRGHAGADVRSFMELKGQLGVKDAEEFNKKSAKDRLRLLDQVIGKNKDVINAFGSTWDAVTSTGQSYLKSIATEGSKPLFELAKQNLKAMNDYAGAMLPQILNMAALFGTLAADAAKAGGNLAVGVGKSLAPRDYATSAVVGAAGPIFNSLATIGMHVVNLLKPLGDALSSVGSAIMGVLAPALAGIGTILETAVGITGVFVRGILFTASVLFDAVGPILARLASAFGTVYGAVSDVVIILAAKAKPYADGFVDMLRTLVTKLAQAADWLATKFGRTGLGDSIMSRLDKVHERAEDARKYLGMERVDAVGWLKAYMAKFNEERAQAEAERKAQMLRIAKDAAKNKRPTIHQDFRGSRFDIEQRFAPGFDPGRVLTALREDAGRMAQRRLSAGITPLFGQG